MDVVVPTAISTAATFTRASNATYHNSVGSLAYAVSNTLRVDYNPTNLTAPPYPLIEPSSASVSTSENFLTGNSILAYTGTTVDYYTTTAPDGSNNVERLVEDTSTGVHGYQTTNGFGVSPPPGVFSIYAKAAERSVIEIVTPSATDTWVFDLGAGTVSASGATPNTTASISAEANGWYRCIVYATVNQGFLLSLTINIRNGGTHTYTGDGLSGVYLWGQQAEVGTTATSYMPSTFTFTNRTSVGSYVNSSGFIASAASGVARTTYNPSNLTAPAKVLIEPAATNLCLYSNTLSGTGSAWSTLGTIGTITTTTGPDGVSTSGQIINDTSATALSGRTQPITVSNDSLARVFSVFIAKTVSATTFPGIELVYTGGTAIGCSVSLNTNTGVANVNLTATATNANPVNTKYLKVDSYNGYWRLSVGLSNNSTGNTTATVNIYGAVTSATSWAASLTGSATFFGAQFEAASVGFQGSQKNITRTSYIATTTVAVTRSADTYTIAGGVRSAETYTKGLLYSNIPENDYPVWNPATTYAIETGTGANSVIYLHNRYSSLRASNLNFNPATDTSSPPYWLLLGPTNQYNMFDQSPGTQTVGTVGGHIVVTVAIGALATLSFINMVADTVTVKLYSAGLLQLTQTIDFTGGTTGVPITDYTLTGLPTFADGLVTLDIFSAVLAPACGNFVTGTRYYLGSTGAETPPTIGIIDYSIKSTDAFGNPTLTKRGYAKRMTTTCVMDISQQDLVSRLLSSVRATPCVWNGNSSSANLTSNQETSMILYGFYQDWEITMTNPNQSYLAMTVQSLI